MGPFWCFNKPLALVLGGGDVKIENQKLNFKEKAQAKVGSLDNVGHSPAGAVKVGAASSASRQRLRGLLLIPLLM